MKRIRHGLKSVSTVLIGDVLLEGGIYTNQVRKYEKMITLIVETNGLNSRKKNSVASHLH